MRYLSSKCWNQHQDHNIIIIIIYFENIYLFHVTRHRPVSNVSFLSKFVERVVYLQIEKYLSSNDLLPSMQSGFRRGHSTETAVLKVYNNALIASDKGEIPCLLLLDYSAAFDTVDHKILLTILEESFGISGLVLAWIRSFLTDRHQIFQVGPDRSPMVVVLYGLPQGTILGPQMYILYTADLESILERHGVKMHLYADDTQLYHHSRMNNLEQAMVKFDHVWRTWFSGAVSVGSNSIPQRQNSSGWIVPMLSKD